MTHTPEMIAAAREARQEAAETAFAQAQTFRIGSRIDLGDGDYCTLVALRLDGGMRMRVVALYSPDSRDHQFGVSTLAEMVDDTDDVTTAPDDAELSASARRDAMADRELHTWYGAHDVLWDNPTSVEQVERVIAFGVADRAWREAATLEAEALKARSGAIEAVCWSMDSNQSATARMIGLDQSRISRAVKAGQHRRG